MKKPIILTLSFLPLLALATNQNQTSLKGSDLISTDVGATYTYVYNHLDKPAKLAPAFDLTVKSCKRLLI